MRSPMPQLPDVFSAAELAKAAGVPTKVVRAAIESGAISTLDGHFLSYGEAIRAGRALRAGVPLVAAWPAGEGTGPEAELSGRPLFSSQKGRPRLAGLPAAASSALHLLAVAALTWMTSMGIGRTEAREVPAPVETSRLVYLNLPGPGGGGGGGGLRQPLPPPRAKREGRSAVSSPLPEREPPPPVEPPKPPEPEIPEIEPEPLPPIIAPVATKPADEETVAGDIPDVPVPTASRGAGEGGGVGAGQGTGLGEGQGAGIGSGTGGGTGGGAYRPGSGIKPPTLLREVKADYSEEARRRGLRGEVLLEIVVRSNGSVGDVRVLRGLGAGLDERAVAAVKQWKFSPATRMGEPVDVIVSVEVEFKLR